MSPRPGLPLDAVCTLLTMVALLACLPAAAHDVHGHESTRRATALTDPYSSDDIHTLIRAFRRTGDDRHLDAAWSRLQPLIAHNMPDVSVLIDAATVAQSRHDFEHALALIDRALAIRPGFDQAWLLRASIQLVRGDAEQAESACRRLRSVPAFIALTCHSRVRIARGEHAHASKMLMAMLTTVDRASANPEALAWALSVAGDAAVAGDPELAIACFEQSLELVESVQVRAALVDVLLTGDRVAAARSVLEAGHDALPLTVRHLIVALRMGEADAVADQIARTDHRFRHWIADQDWAHAREMARFYIDVLDRPALARRLVRINLTFQREPEDRLLAHRVGECASCVR